MRQYRLTPLLPHPDGNEAGAYATNGIIVVGATATGPKGCLDGKCACYWPMEGGEPTLLHEPRSYALGISECGDIAGTVGGEDVSQAVVWSAENGIEMQYLGTLGGRRSRSQGMSADGHIVGNADTSHGIRRAFLWHPATVGQSARIESLGTFGGHYSEGRCVVNGEHGLIVGGMAYTQGNRQVPFLWRDGDGAMSAIGTPGWLHGQVECVHWSGWAVADGDDCIGHYKRAWLWNNYTQTATDITAPEAQATHAYTIAAVDGHHEMAGAVTVSGEDCHRSQHAVWWDRGLQIHTLLDVVPDAGGWTSLCRVNDFRDDGTMIGNGMHKGQYMGFVARRDGEE